MRIREKFGVRDRPKGASPMRMMDFVTCFMDTRSRVGQSQLLFIKQVSDSADHGDALSDDGGPGGARYPLIHHPHKQEVQNDIGDKSGAHGDHGKDGTAVVPDQRCQSHAEDLQHGADSHDENVFLAHGKQIAFRAEQLKKGSRKKQYHCGQQDTGNEQEPQGARHKLPGFFRLFLPPGR